MVASPQPPPDLARLQTPEAAAALARLGLDHLLQIPLQALVQPSWLAERLLAALGGVDRVALVASLQNEFEGMRGLLPAAASGPAATAPIQAHLPEGIEGALGVLAGEARIPLRETLETLLDHPAMREILRAVLLDTLTRFSGKVGSFLGEASRIPGASRLPGAARLGSVLGLARGVGSALVDELSRQLEGRAGPFVDGALSRAMKIGLDALADPAREEALLGWRKSAMGALLELPLAALEAEAARLDPEAVADALASIATTFGAWEGAAEKLERVLLAAGADTWGRPLGEGIEAWGFDLQALRVPIEAKLAEQLALFLEGEAFGRWLAGEGSA